MLRRLKLDPHLAEFIAMLEKNSEKRELDGARDME
jgi:hypothetical protein